MKYTGSKRRYAEELKSLILPYRLEGMTWVEPFVGGGNMISTISGRRIGSDSHSYLIALLTAIRDGWVPPEYVTEDEYNHIKRNQDLYPPSMVGFAGFSCPFGGKWMRGFARCRSGRNYALEGRNNLLKQAPTLQGVHLECCDYRELKIPLVV